MFYLVVSFLVSCAFVGGLYICSPYWRFRLRKIPGPPPLPLLYNIPEIAKHKDRIVGCLHTWGQKYGKMYKIFIGYNPWVVISDPALLREVMVTRFSHFAERGAVVRAVPSLSRNPTINEKNGGLLLAEGEYWRGTRATWHRFFNHSVGLDYYKPVMDKAVSLMMATIERKVVEGGKKGDKASIVKVSRVLQSMTMVAVGGSAFGVDLATEDFESPHEIVTEASAFFEGSVGSANPYVYILGLFPHLLPLWRHLAYKYPLGQMKNLNKGRVFIHRNIHAWIKEARAATGRILSAATGEVVPQANGNNGQAAATNGKGRVSQAGAEDKGRDAGSGNGEAKGKKPLGLEAGGFIRMLVESEDKSTGKPLSDVQVTSHTLTAVLAGYETTSGALAFTLYLLAKHPDCQDRAAREARGVVEGLDKGGEIRPEDMPYLEACLSESLRIYPPAPMVHRETSHETTLGGYSLPKGTTVCLDFYSMHHSPLYWTAPEAFRPERFLGDAPEPKVPGAYLPFGAGPRACVGMKFALQEARLALARLLDRFRFELPPGMEDLPVRFAITLAPRDGLQLRVGLRE